MKQFYLAEITTSDNLIHQGLFFQPSHKASADKVNRALLWTHGLTDTFYGDKKLYEAFTDEAEKTGIAFAVFNNRGHDVVTSITKVDPKSAKGTSSFWGGAAYENFEESVFDIDAGISFLAAQGYSQIFIAGSSTGANKVCYYAGTQKDPRVIGVILASPLSDVAINKHYLGKKYHDQLQKMRALSKTKEANKLLDDVDYFPLTPNRYLSLYTENSAEDTFPYYQKKPSFTLLKKITLPLLLIVGESDEYTDRPIDQIVGIFNKQQTSKSFKSVVIPQAFHSLKPQEKRATKEIFSWISSL